MTTEAQEVTARTVAWMDAQHESDGTDVWEWRFVGDPAWLTCRVPSSLPGNTPILVRRSVPTCLRADNHGPHDGCPGAPSLRQGLLDAGIDLNPPDA